jgi:membrane associated rhomboid family serine protease
MGIYDRDYYRQEQRGFSLRVPHSVVNQLILANVIVWLADAFFFNNSLDRYLGASTETLTHPLAWWQFITYGFVHSPQPEHVIVNMLVLWMFGRDVEAIYGGKEFFKLYLALVAFGSISWAIGNRLMGTSLGVPVVGASAAVAGVLLLNVLHYPHRTLLLFFVLPVPAWLAGIFLIGIDVLGTLGNSNVAHGAHLGGVALAFAYFHWRWNFTNLFARLMQTLRSGRPRLRVHHPRPDDTAEPSDLRQEVDRILEKITREGEASLTRQERSTLENASRHYQQRRQP